MSAGAQRGAACCHGDRQAPSDQQLLACSCLLPFHLPCSSAPSSQPSSLAPVLFSFIFLLFLLFLCLCSSTWWWCKKMDLNSRAEKRLISWWPVQMVEWTHLSWDTHTQTRTDRQWYAHWLTSDTSHVGIQGPVWGAGSVGLTSSYVSCV